MPPPSPAIHPRGRLSRSLSPERSGSGERVRGRSVRRNSRSVKFSLEFPSISPHQSPEGSPRRPHHTNSSEYSASISELDTSAAPHNHHWQDFTLSDANAYALSIQPVLGPGFSPPSISPYQFPGQEGDGTSNSIFVPDPAPHAGAVPRGPRSSGSVSYARGIALGASGMLLDLGHGADSMAEPCKGSLTQSEVAWKDWDMDCANQTDMDYSPSLTKTTPYPSLKGFSKAGWRDVECRFRRTDAAHSGGWTLILQNTTDEYQTNTFRGPDFNSIFKTGAPKSVAKRFQAMFSWNDNIQLPMQRYHLPFVGKILSPGDQTLSFSGIPTSDRTINALAKFLFVQAISTPPSSGSGMIPVDSQYRPWLVFSDFQICVQIADDIFHTLDFPLACALLSHWFGSGPCNGIYQHGRSKTDRPPLTFQNLKRQGILSNTERETYISEERGIITAPYQVYPRRLWDLKVNRVIPFYLLKLLWTEGPVPRYVAISHSWVRELELDYIYTPINQESWAVPLPKGIDLEHIRNEVLGYFPSIRYCWLDVLCLRQARLPGPPTNSQPMQHSILKALTLGLDPSGSHRQAELGIDVPTIGNIYKNAAGILRYFNGLGKVFRSDQWDDEHHWLNRAWTLQESSARSVNGGLPETCMNPLNTITIWRGTQKRLRDCLSDLEDTVRGLISSKSIIALASEMSRRYASSEIDKIAGLSYLLHFNELPIYSTNEAVEHSWKRCLNSAPGPILAELFFNSPYSGLFGLFPTWGQLQSSAKTIVQQQLPSASSVTFELDVYSGQDFVPDVLGGPHFNGYHIYARISKPDQDGIDYNVLALPNPRPRYQEMNMNLRFFLGHAISTLSLSDDPTTVYQLFTHDLLPCSSWVVIHDGAKIGILCSDEVFVGLHRTQVIEKGTLTVANTTRLYFQKRN